MPIIFGTNLRKEVVMRKTWLAIVMILILISSTGCQQNIGKKNLGDKFVVGQDDQPNILTGDSGLASSKEGTYIMDCGKLDYFDYKTQSIVPVCNKTECDHNDRMSCNAYCCGDANEIWYYDDSIYFVGSDYTKEMAEGLSLYRVKKDGTGKEKLYDLYLLSEDVAGEMSAVIDVAIHRGYVYYDEVDYDKEKKEDITRLCRKKLKKNAQK